MSIVRSYSRTDDNGTLTTGTPVDQADLTAILDMIDVFVGNWTAWTPRFGGATSESGQAHSVQVGRYMKVNKKITFYGACQLSTLGTITGSVQIKGLPTANTSTANRYPPVSIGYFGNLTNTFVDISGEIAPSDTAITLRGLKVAAVSKADLAQADLSATTLIRFGGFYEID